MFENALRVQTPNLYRFPPKKKTISDESFLLSGEICFRAIVFFSLRWSAITVTCKKQIGYEHNVKPSQCIGGILRWDRPYFFMGTYVVNTKENRAEVPGTFSDSKFI
jgi:hypothetical protein